MQEVFSNVNDIFLFLMIFPGMNAILHAILRI